MKSLLFILLAGYAVRSDENNYYVIEMPDDAPLQTEKPFKVYWNVPTMQCASKKVYFEDLYEKFGIIQNDNDRFKGEKVTILYDPGLFPALFKNETSGRFRFRNGGVPQEGDLEKHLDEFKSELDSSIPDEEYNGIGIIDFESWRPIFRQNFGDLRPYKDVSIEIERKLHWWWRKTWIEAEAKRRFEEAAQTFMQTTLSLAKQLRPNALWGFYGFPYCFNMASNNMVESCASNVPEENDQIKWLWSESTALYPSVYSSVNLSTSQLESLIRGRIREAARCGQAMKTINILPYFWFRYRDDGFLTETDLNVALSTLYQSNATGIIIWGSSNDVNTLTKCNNLLDYVENIFGPAIAKYTKTAIKENDEDENSTLDTNNNVTESPILNDSSYFSTKLDQESTELHWTLPENYTKDVTTHEEETITSPNVTVDTVVANNDTVLQNNSILIDLILNTVLNSLDNTTSTDTSKTKDEKKGLQEQADVESSTTDIIETSTDTSQVTSSLLLSDINNTSPNVELQTNDSTSVNEVISTEKTVTQTTDIDKYSTYAQSESGTTDSVTEIPITAKSNVEMTENYYDDTFDDEDDYFFNLDTFVDDRITTIADQTTDATAHDFDDFETKITKDHKKGFPKTSTVESLLNTSNLEITTDFVDFVTTKKNESIKTVPSEFTDIDSTTVSITEIPSITTERNTEMTETSSTYAIVFTKDTISTESVTNPTETTPSLLTISTESIEVETRTSTDESEPSDRSILTTTPGFTDLQTTEVLRTMRNKTDVTKNLDIGANTEESMTPNITKQIHIASPEESETSKSTIMTDETTASVVPITTSIMPTTSTEQVVVNI